MGVFNVDILVGHDAGMGWSKEADQEGITPYK